MADQKIENGSTDVAGLGKQRLTWVCCTATADYDAPFWYQADNDGFRIYEKAAEDRLPASDVTELVGAIAGWIDDLPLSSFEGLAGRKLRPDSPRGFRITTRGSEDLIATVRPFWAKLKASQSDDTDEP